MTEINNENNIIIARQQQRRGLKQDIPQPLRPGEIGFAVDSQQLFIGTDDRYPFLTPYQNSCVFETTVNAREHTISIANNQIIAFTVPFIKYSQGQFNGITTVKQWQPTFSRSIISSSLNPECKHTSSDFNVFSDSVTSTVLANAAVTATGVTTIELNGLNELDPTGNIRVGDVLNITDPLSDSANIVSVNFNAVTNRYELVVDKNVDLTLASNVTITKSSIYNNFTNQLFKTSDVIVKRNGIQLSGDEDNTNQGVPGPQYEYTFSTPDKSSTAVQQLVLRTSPKSSDEITVAYYSNTQVIQAIEGNQVTGNISPYINKTSFYTEYDIPEYRKIPLENIRVSTSTGVGFIAFQDIHIASIADGSNLSSTTGLTLGNLLIARNDEQFDTSNCAINSSNSQRYDIEVEPIVANRFSPILDTSGAYRFNRVKFVSSGNEFRYLHDNYFNVVSVDAILGKMTVELPSKNFSMLRECNVELASSARYLSNGYTGSGSDTVATIKTDSEGIEKDDWLRIVDTLATNQLHDTVFSVLAVRPGQIDVRVTSSGVYSGNVVPTFSQNHSGLFFTSHGSTVSGIDSVIQVYSNKNELTSEVSNVNVTSVSAPYSTGLNTVDNTRITSNTFFLTNQTIGASDGLATDGEYYADLADSYTNIDIVPVLAIDLRANTTLAEVTTTVNRELVSTKQFQDPEQIFPQLDYAPQTNGDLNRLYLTQDPGYSSVGVGGLEFSLYEDRDRDTLSVLGFTAGTYDRNTNTVKAKFEKWFNELMLDRDVNLFSSVLLCGDSYKEFPYTELNENSPFYNKVISSTFGNYNLVIDDTYSDLLFCDQQEASNFAFLANKMYSRSLFDKSNDFRNGVRGLLNTRRNIEITTREQAGIGSQILSFPAQTQAVLLRTLTYDKEVFRLPIAVYNSHSIEYTINSFGSTAIDTYSRVGSMLVVSNAAINDSAINDRFSSVWVKVDGAPIVEPRFYVEIVGSDVVFKLEQQYRDILNQLPGDTLAHSFDADLLMKFNIKRWSSYEE